MQPGAGFSYYPVIITGDTATIYLHHELAYGRAYYGGAATHAKRPYSSGPLWM